jgi:hypothetical protein
VFVDDDAHIFKSQNPLMIVGTTVLFWGAVNVASKKAGLIFCVPDVIVVWPKPV